MPQPGMSQEFKNEVARLAINEGWGAQRIRNHLSDRRDEFSRLGWIRPALGEDVPSVSAIGRHLKKDVRGMSENRRRYFQQVVWPDSFGGQDLPWESAATVLELARDLANWPPVPLAIQFVRVTLAAPDAPLVERRELARALVKGDPDALSRVRWYVAMAPWREEYRAGYEAAFPEDERWDPRPASLRTSKKAGKRRGPTHPRLPWMLWEPETPEGRAYAAHVEAMDAEARVMERGDTE